MQDNKASRMFLIVAVVLGVLATVLAFAFINSTAGVDRGPKALKIVVASHDLRANGVIDPDRDLEGDRHTGEHHGAGDRDAGSQCAGELSESAVESEHRDADAGVFVGLVECGGAGAAGALPGADDIGGYGADHSGGLCENYCAGGGRRRCESGGRRAGIPRAGGGRELEQDAVAGDGGGSVCGREFEQPDRNAGGDGGPGEGHRQSDRAGDAEEYFAHLPPPPTRRGSAATSRRAATPAALMR